MIRPFPCLLLSLLLFAGGCGEQIEPGRRDGEPTEIGGLELERAELRPVAVTEAFPGSVEARDRGVLSARIDARVAEVKVAEGDAVAAGELLLVLADNPADEHLREAEGGRRAAEALLQLAEQTHERYARLFAREAVTPQEMDRVRTELETARQQLAAARAAEAAAATAAGYNRIVAPYPATVVRRQVDEGSVVLPGSPLLVLDRHGRRQVRAELPETYLGRFRSGDLLEVELPALGRSVSGEVAEVVSAADPRSRTFTMKLLLPADLEAAPGLFARVLVTPGERQTVLVPESALLERGQLRGLFVVEDGLLRYRMIKTGRQRDGRVEILSGLEPGETIVVRGVERAVAGARVGP